MRCCRRWVYSSRAGGAGSNRLVDWRHKSKGWQNIKIHPCSEWVKPFVSDLKRDNSNQDIQIVLSEKGAKKPHRWSSKRHGR